jgi:hypothetical protein
VRLLQHQSIYNPLPLGKYSYSYLQYNPTHTINGDFSIKARNCCDRRVQGPWCKSLRPGIIGLANAVFQLEWVKQLSRDPENFVVALARNPDSAQGLKPLLGQNVVAVRGDVADFDSFPVCCCDALDGYMD